MSLGLIGRRVQLPLFPFVSGEKSYFGSFWGNDNDLTEVLALADAGLIKHNVPRSRSTTSTTTLMHSAAATSSGVR